MIFNCFQLKTFVNNTTSAFLYVTDQNVIVNVNIAYLAEPSNIRATTSKKLVSREESLSRERLVVYKSRPQNDHFRFLSLCHTRIERYALACHGKKTL